MLKKNHVDLRFVDQAIMKKYDLHEAQVPLLLATEALAIMDEPPPAARAAQAQPRKMNSYCLRRKEAIWDKARMMTIMHRPKTGWPY